MASSFDKGMLEDLATTATIELKERMTARDGSKPVSIARSILDEYMPQDDAVAQRKFASFILNDPEMSRVWRTLPKGKSILLRALIEKKQTAAAKSDKVPKKKVYEVERYVPSRMGEFVVVNRGSVPKPLFYIGQINGYLGEGKKRYVVVGFGDPRIDDTPYPAFSESALGIVAFADLVAETGKPPIVTSESLQELAYPKRWMAEEAMRLWMRGQKAFVKAIREQKKRMTSLDEPDDEEAIVDARQADMAADQKENGEADGDAWLKKLPQNVRKKLKDADPPPEHLRTLRYVYNTKADVLDVICRKASTKDGDWGEDDFQIDVHLNKYGSIFALSTQDDKEWDVFRVLQEGETSDAELLGDIENGVAGGTLDEALAFIEGGVL